MDLTKILKKGDSVYCPLYGEGVVNNEPVDNSRICISVSYGHMELNRHVKELVFFTSDGRLFRHFENEEKTPSEGCLLFPEKGVYTWENYSRFKPRQVVLVWNNTENYKKVRVFYKRNSNGRYAVTSHLVQINDNLVGDNFEFFDNCEEYNPELVHFSDERIF